MVKHLRRRFRIRSGSGVHTVCGLHLGRSKTTPFVKQVTCKNCQRVVAVERRG